MRASVSFALRATSPWNSSGTAASRTPAPPSMARTANFKTLESAQMVRVFGVCMDSAASNRSAESWT